MIRKNLKCKALPYLKRKHNLHVYVYKHRIWYMLAYTKCDVQLIKVVPDDGLIQSEKCRTSNRK